MKSPLINKKVILNRTLYAAYGGGVAIMPNGGRHGEIKLHTNQNANAVTFPISSGTIGQIVDEDGASAFVVRLNCHEKLSGYHSFQQVNFVVSKGSMGGFFKYE